LALLHNQAITD